MLSHIKYFLLIFVLLNQLRNLIPIYYLQIWLCAKEKKSVVIEVYKNLLCYEIF